MNDEKVAQYLATYHLRVGFLDMIVYSSTAHKTPFKGVASGL
jgi:hypothetical protein